MDYMLEKISGLLDKLGSKIPKMDVPWSYLDTYQKILDEYLSQANMIFPIEAILTILIAYGTVRAVLLAIWVLQFLRNLLPF